MVHPGADESTLQPAGLSSTTEATVYSAKQVRRVRELLTCIYAARRTIRLYPADHPAMAEAISALKKVVDQYHSEGVDIEIAFFEDDLLLGQQLLAEESILFDQLIRDMTSIGAGTLKITRGVDLPELARAMSILALDSHVIELGGGISYMMTEADVTHVKVGSVKIFEKAQPPPVTLDEAHESYDNAIQLLREIDSLVRRNRMVSAVKVRNVVRSLIDNVLSNRYAMLELSGLKNYDEYTFYHSANVAILSLALGSVVTSDYRFLSSLGIGALLHDTGKMMVDYSVLNKPRALTAEEWALVKQHPVYGAQRVMTMPGLDKSSVVVIHEHHMRYDGSGYPGRVVYRPQHLASRIVAVADAFDAMTSRRAYSAAHIPHDALMMLVQGAGSAFDPTLTRLFVSMMGVYPPRSIVRLEDGRTGVVLRPSQSDLLRPVVRIIADADGQMVEPVLVDLAAAGEPGVRMCLDPADININVDDYM